MEEEATVTKAVITLTLRSDAELYTGRNFSNSEEGILEFRKFLDETFDAEKYSLYLLEGASEKSVTFYAPENI